MADATVGYLFNSPILSANSGFSGSTSRLFSFERIPWAGSFSGMYKVAGTVKLDGVPMPEVLAKKVLVVLFPHENPGALLSSALTPDATFEFDGVAPGQYEVVGIDKSDTYNSRAKANITAVPR